MNEAYTGRFMEGRPEEWNNFDTECPTIAATSADPVKHPAHYCKGGIECIDAIRASMSREAFCGYCKGNSLKYLWRYEHKGRRVEDLEKAQVYLGWLIDEEKKPCA